MANHKSMTVLGAGRIQAVRKDRLTGESNMRYNYLPFVDQWKILSKYMLQNGMFVRATDLNEAQEYSEKKKAILNLARYFVRCRDSSHVCECQAEARYALHHPGVLFETSGSCAIGWQV